MRLKLPRMYCADPDCGIQLVNHIYVDSDTDKLICGFCARDRDPDSVVALTGGKLIQLVGPSVEELSPLASARLLIHHGAEIVAD